MPKITVMDWQFRDLGQIDKYSSLMLGKSWAGIGKLEFHLDDQSAHHEALTCENIVYTDDDRAYVIKTRTQSSDTGEVVISGFELKRYLGEWIVYPPEGKAYHALNAPAETIMKTYVADTLARKGITNITVAPDQGRGKVTSYQARYNVLSDVLQELSLDSGLGWDVRLDHDNKQFVFDCYVGLDRTEDQDTNPEAVFAVEYDNIVSQTITHDKSSYANTAVVAGQGEGEYRIIETVGDNDQGFFSYEIFVDARDIEYDEYLADRGRQKLAELPEVLAFDSQVSPDSGLRYREGWNLGDIVTTVNNSWGVKANVRVTEVTEIYEQTGFRLDVTFGAAQLTLTDKIKQITGGPVVEGGGTGVVSDPADFVGESINEGTQIALSWSIAYDSTFARCEVYRSSADLSSATYQYCAEHAELVYSGSAESLTVGATANTRHHFKLFSIYALGGSALVSTGVAISVYAEDLTPPDPVTGITAKGADGVLTLTWTNPTNADHDKTRAYYTTALPYPTSPTDPRATLGLEATPAQTSGDITGLVNGVEIYVRFFTYDVAGNINDDTSQQISGTPVLGDDTSGSPGGINLIGGTMEAGYFGVVSGTDLIGGNALASQVGISSGTAQFDNAGWLKFAYQGKIQFVAKKPFRHSISWNNISSANCIYGGKTIVINGLTYKVRLMRGANKDPAGGYNGAICHGSEWNKLMLPIHENAAPGKSWLNPGNVGASDTDYWGINFTDSDLHTHNSYGSGTYSWCQEVAESSSYRMIRGISGVSFADSYSPSSTSTARGWRPVLELVP